MKRILNDTEKEVLKCYASYCDFVINKRNDKWACAEKVYFGIMRQTEKACYVNFSITDLREFDEKTGERIHPDGMFRNNTYIYFWCPKKFMGHEIDIIPYWFLKEKINEFLNSN